MTSSQRKLLQIRAEFANNLGVGIIITGCLGSVIGIAPQLVAPANTALHLPLEGVWITALVCVFFGFIAHFLGAELAMRAGE